MILVGSFTLILYQIQKLHIWLEWKMEEKYFACKVTDFLIDISNDLFHKQKFCNFFL